MPEAQPISRGRAVKILAGRFKGQTGEVSGYDTGRAGYLVKIRHEGYPEGHFHHERYSPKHLEVIPGESPD